MIKMIETKTRLSDNENFRHVWELNEVIAGQYEKMFKDFGYTMSETETERIWKYDYGTFHGQYAIQRESHVQV